MKKEDFAHTIRNYRRQDFHSYVQLIIDAEKLEPSGLFAAPRFIVEYLNQPKYCPERDLFVAEIDGNLVGYIDVKPELTLRRVILNCWVRPEHRRRGLATQLSGYAIHRGRELGTQVAHVKILENNAIARTVLPRFGFASVRRFFEMKIDVAQLSEKEVEQALPRCRQLRCGEEDELTSLQNRCFAGTWGFNPNSTEEITYKINASGRSPEDVILAEEGNKVVGYCWTELIEEADRRKGRIFMLGVDPDYRGRGIGKRVLLCGLVHLRNKGLRTVELTTESDNKVACALYRSLGFETVNISLWYERAID